MDLNARKNFVKRNYLCFLSLNSHKYKECPNNYLKCSICRGKHNSLLHEDIKSNNSSVSDPKPNSRRNINHTAEGSVRQREQMLCNESTNLQVTINSSTSINNSKCTSFLPTAKVLLHNNEGLKRKNDRLSLSGISGVPEGTTRDSIKLKIGSRFNEEFVTVNAYILNKVTSQIPVENIDTKDLDYLKGVTLSAEDFSRPSECDIILGSDCFFTILRNGRIIGSEGQPITQSTMFGWVVAG
ncbi:hypothetical protein AVEN_93368-1 [Araneus ventricosus]|uniref:Uncharacterized protein n=1 Tax=Araneus ventricosus TaxID=182803 RepID=A0A4Y2ARD5_ARAVE|nr:hypothetical protein AVEN_93368-1 [Araneus ventricosus]